MKTLNRFSGFFNVQRPHLSGSPSAEAIALQKLAPRFGVRQSSGALVLLWCWVIDVWDFRFRTASEFRIHAATITGFPLRPSLHFRRTL